MQNETTTPAPDGTSKIDMRNVTASEYELRDAIDVAYIRFNSVEAMSKAVQHFAQAAENGAKKPVNAVAEIVALSEILIERVNMLKEALRDIEAEAITYVNATAGAT